MVGCCHYWRNKEANLSSLGWYEKGGYVGQSKEKKLERRVGGSREGDRGDGVTEGERADVMGR